jgi:hypothetical protein
MTRRGVGPQAMATGRLEAARKGMKGVTIEKGDGTLTARFSHGRKKYEASATIRRLSCVPSGLPHRSWLYQKRGHELSPLMFVS